MSIMGWSHWLVMACHVHLQRSYEYFIMPSCKYRKKFTTKNWSQSNPDKVLNVFNTFCDVSWWPISFGFLCNIMGAYYNIRTMLYNTHTTSFNVLRKFSRHMLFVSFLHDSTQPWNHVWYRMQILRCCESVIQYLYEYMRIWIIYSSITM